MSLAPARPSASEIRAHAAQSLGATLPPLMVAAERVAATVAQGVHGRRRVGQGDTFWQFRPLLPGEAASRIDWRRSARASSGHFVRQTEWEAAQTVVIWRSGGEGMRWRSAPEFPEKSARADLLLLALATLLLRGGERVRFLSGAPHDVTGRAGLPRLAELIEDSPSPRALPEPAGVPRHGCVVLISDWLEPLDEIRDALGRLAAVHVTGHVLQILDPAEVALPYTGRVRFTSPDLSSPAGRATAALIGRTESVRDAYAGRLRDQQAGLASICHASGLSFSVHRTDHSAGNALLALHAALSPQRVRG